MKGCLILGLGCFALLCCVTACAKKSPRVDHGVAHQVESHQTKASQEKFVRYNGVKQPLYYPANFYSYDAQKAQDRSARGWWNQ